MTTLVPFADGKRCSEFSDALLLKLMRRVAKLREEIIPPQNISNLPHGHGWKFQQQREDGYFPETGQFKRHSTEICVETKRILSQDLRIVEEFVIDLAKRMHDEFMTGLFQELDSTCNRFGRVTDLRESSSFTDGFLASLASIQTSVDENGNVSPPFVALPPQLIERLNAELVSRRSEFEEKVAEIHAQAEITARKNEEQRLAKYDEE